MRFRGWIPSRLDNLVRMYWCDFVDIILASPLGVTHASGLGLFIAFRIINAFHCPTHRSVTAQTRQPHFPAVMTRGAHAIQNLFTLTIDANR
jgi:hypothetical protein